MNTSTQLTVSQPANAMVGTFFYSELQDGNARLQAHLQERFATTLSDYQHLLENLIHADTQEQIASALTGHVGNRVAYTLKTGLEVGAICLENQKALMSTIQASARNAQA
jgi:hypothetical protein